MIIYNNLQILTIRIQNQIKKNQKLKTLTFKLINNQPSNIYFNKMSSSQIQITYMVSKLKQWGQTLGVAQNRRKLAGCEFDAWQQQFLVKRYQTEKLQNQKETQGLNTKTASHGFKIREGIELMQTALGRMKQQNRKLTKKQADSQQNLSRRQKIIKNCQTLFQDIKDRQKLFNDPNSHTKPTKVVTLTDMRAKLLSDIQEQNYKLHQQDSQGHLTQTNQQQLEAMQKFKQKDIQMDGVLDDIIDGVQGITAKVKGINKKQDQVIEKTHKNKDKVIKVSKRIQTDNDKLKVIIQKFSKGRCCMSITLGLLFIGLIVVIIKMFVIG